MNLLLDTHVVLWWLADDPALADDIKAALDREPNVYVSAATIWEVDIKVDRMLIAQARCEGLTLVTGAGRCQQYEVAVLRA